MSYPPISNYYGSSNQQSSTGNSAYSVNRGSGTYNYPSSTNGTSNATYSSSSYNYPSQSSYAGSNNVEQSIDPYASSSNYGYQRTGNDEQDTAMADAYNQGYYGRSNVATTQQQQGQPEGLSNLAYASGLESATSRSNTSRAASQYGNTRATSQQARVRSPAVETSRYSMNPAPSTSYPAQQQASTSSTTSQQLAVNASAALAGAVSRRYSNQQHGQNASTSPNVLAARAAVNTTPVSNNSSHQQTSYASSQNAQPPYQVSQQYTSAYETIPQANTSSHPTQSGTSSSARQGVKSRSAQSSQPRQSAGVARRDIQQTGSIANLVSATHEADNGFAAASDVPDTAPGFIDPTAVFDPYHRERERKKMEAVASAKKKAEDAARLEEVRKQQELQQQQQADTQKQNTASKAKPSSANKKRKRISGVAAVEEPTAPEQTEEERMAQELKSMMEKMKAFQSKDPSLFKKLWNDMKQPGASSNGTNIQSPSPQIAPRNLPKAPTSTPAAKNTVPQQSTPIPQPIPVSQTPATAPDTGEKSRKKKAAQTGPDGEKLRLNGYPVIVENNPEGLPDLGRFPAERRIRLHKYNRKEKGPGQSLEPDSILENDNATSPSIVKRPGSAKAKAAGTPAALSGALSAATGMTTSKANAATNAASGTVWPLEKRNALTQTALKALKANPENANIPLTEEDVRKMLENNPSYITLCELLEGRGLKFHRGHFARELLDSVPELKTPAAGQKAAAENATRSAGNNNNAQTNAGPDPASLTQPVYAHPPGIPIPPPGYMVRFHPPDQPPAGHFIPVSQQWGQGALFPSIPGAPPSSQAKKPGTRLTHRPEAPPGSKEAAARQRGFAALIDLTELDENDNYVLPERDAYLEGPDSDVDMEDNPLQAFQRGAMPRPPQQVSIPSTAGWFPPSGQPMLFNPQQANTHIKTDAFPENKSHRMILAKCLNKDEALKKQYYDPKTVARDILIASGRHPYERPLNVHLAGMLGKYIDLDSDVSTFEWGELDPGGPPVPEVDLVDIPATKPKFKLGERVIKKQKSRVTSDRTHQLETEKRPNIEAPPVTPATAQARPQSIPQSQTAKLKKSSGLRHSLLASDTYATPATLDPIRHPQVQSDRSQVHGSITAMADNTAPAPKKRGRPVGSKNKYPSLTSMRDQAAGLTINVPTRESRENDPRREKFKCKWKKCSVILHNLDTLRKHIGINHRPSSDEIAAGNGFTCWWKHCDFIEQDADGEYITTKKFDGREEWIKHMESKHITPIAMKHGDGPSLVLVGKQT